MMQGTDPSSLPLRDIHLPEPVSWWPLAPGWWILLFLIIVIIAGAVFFVKRRNAKRISAIVLAKKEIERIQNEFNLNQDKSFLARELSELLRRVSISIFPRKDTASLTGETWLVFLDEYSDDKSFNKGLGRVLIDAPYQSSPQYDSDSLIVLVSGWIESVSRNKQGKTK